MLPSTSAPAAPPINKRYCFAGKHCHHVNCNGQGRREKIFQGQRVHASDQTFYCDPDCHAALLEVDPSKAEAGSVPEASKRGVKSQEVGYGGLEG